MKKFIAMLNYFRDRINKIRRKRIAKEVFNVKALVLHESQQIYDLTNALEKFCFSNYYRMEICIMDSGLYTLEKKHLLGISREVHRNTKVYIKTIRNLLTK